MACPSITLQSIALECKDNMGGLKSVYIINHNKVSGLTVADDDATSNAGCITGIDVTSGSTFVKWNFRRQSASMTSNGTVDDVAGTVFFQTDVALQFNKMEGAKRLQMIAATFEDTAVVVKDQNDRLWYLGEDNPVSASSTAGNSGTNMGDANGYNLTLTDYSKQLPREIVMDASALAALGID